MQIWRVAVNTFNNWSLIAHKELPSGLGVWQGTRAHREKVA